MALELTRRTRSNPISYISYQNGTHLLPLLGRVGGDAASSTRQRGKTALRLLRRRRRGRRRNTLLGSAGKDRSGAGGGFFFRHNFRRLGDVSGSDSA